MKRKTPATKKKKSPLLTDLARKVGGVAGSIVHAGTSLATAAATIVETGREIKSKGKRALKTLSVVKKKRKPAKTSAVKKKSSQSKKQRPQSAR